MKVIKSIICISLVVLMSLFTLSCENIGVDKSILNQKNKISNKVEYKNFEMLNYYKEKKVIYSTYGYISSQLYIKNNEIYLLGNPYDLGMNVSIQENSEKNGCIVFDKNGDQKASFLIPKNDFSNLQIISDDVTILTLSEVKNQSSYKNYNIIEVDNNGKEIKKYDLNDFFYKKNYNIIDFKKTKENDLVISYVDQKSKKIVVIDENKNIKFKSEDLEEKDYKYFILNDNSTEAIYLENGIYKIATLDIENKKIHNENELYGFDELFLFNLKSGVGKYSFIFMHNDSIFGYDKETKKIVDIINLTNANVDGNISDYAMLNEEEVVITKYNDNSYEYETVITHDSNISYEEFNRTKNNNLIENVLMKGLSDEYHTVVSIYSPISKEEFSKIDNRKIITIGGVNIEEEVLSLIKDFNIRNEEYKIMVKDYSSYSGYYNYTQAASDLNEDLMSGNVPDIIISNSNYSIEHLINKGVLAELNSYIENDKEIIKDDYLEKAFEIGKRGNGLYYFYPSFRVKTLVGEKEEVGEKKGWDINEFIKFSSEKREESPFITYSKRALFELLLNLYMEDYIDYEKNTCNFEKESFVKILEFIKENSEKMISREVYLEGYSTGVNKNAYLNEANIYSFADLMQILRKVDYGDGDFYINGEKIDTTKEVTLKGMPSKSGNGSAFLPEYIVAISEHSENKDAAWEFVKKFLSDEFQNSNPIIFPIKKSAFTDENYSEYNDFISSLSQVYVSDVKILDIIEEEYYYLETGESTATQVARQVQKRVIKYLEQLSK